MPVPDTGWGARRLDSSPTVLAWSSSYSGTSILLLRTGLVLLAAYWPSSSTGSSVLGLYWPSSSTGSSALVRAW
eukprot:1309655-Rhodomonas_salina.3